MQTPARLLRATAAEIPGLRPVLSPKAQARKHLILLAARTVFAAHGRHSVTLAAFALAIWTPASLIRRLFIDLDGLLAELILDHLRIVECAVGAVSPDAADAAALRRRAYLDATRTAAGGVSDAHRLLIRDRHTLPADLLGPIEQRRADLAQALCEDHPIIGMGLLDNSGLHPQEIEAEFAARMPKADPARSRLPRVAAGTWRHAPPRAARMEAAACIEPAEPAAGMLVSRQAGPAVQARAGPA